MSDSSTPTRSLEARQQRSSVFRRLVMPLLIVLVAGAILIWGRQTEERDLREVDDAVRSLTYEIFYSPPDGPLPHQARQMRMTHATVDRIQQVFRDYDWNQIHIDVYAGDTRPPYGDGRATHHAIISINHQQRLGLRLFHAGRPEQIEVLGYWVAGTPDP
jgi:hypothetical protein